MKWHAVVYWQAEGHEPGGWRWRVWHENEGVLGEGPVASQEEGRRCARECLVNRGLKTSEIPIEVWDEGVWDKC